jgi:hypothetical protein
MQVVFFSVAEPEPSSRNKIVPGAGVGAEITNCGSGSSSGPDSFPFFEKFYRKKSWLQKKFL